MACDQKQQLRTMKLFDYICRQYLQTSYENMIKNVRDTTEHTSKQHVQHTKAFHNDIKSLQRTIPSIYPPLTNLSNFTKPSRNLPKPNKNVRNPKTSVKSLRNILLSPRDEHCQDPKSEDMSFAMSFL